MKNSPSVEVEGNGIDIVPPKFRFFTTGPPPPLKSFAITTHCLVFY